MQICFDIETAHHDAFKWLPRDYTDACDIIDNLDIPIAAATAYIFDQESDPWRSYCGSEIPHLCRLVAAATTVITYNGKLEDIPTIRSQCTIEAHRAKLKRLAAMETGDKHHDMHQIAVRLCAKEDIKRFDLCLWNFGQDYLNDQRARAHAYKRTLMNAGWAEHDAYKASNAYNDVNTTVDLWKRWRVGELKVTE
jgi:hypothetical protein